MDSPAEAFFQSLSSYSSVEALIDAGEAAGQHLECKAPSSPEIGRDTRSKLSTAASGFANSGGGVIVWGMATVKHEASGLDVLTQIEPIGRIKRFAQQIDSKLTGLTMPRLATPPTRVLYRSKKDTSGIAVTYIPLTPGDPVQSIVDQQFYLRSGDAFIKMPYEMLRRMFAGAVGPLLKPIFDARLVEIDATGKWRVPILLQNESSAVARDVRVVVTIDNPDSCAAVECDGFKDASSVNPGDQIFIAAVERPTHRGLNNVAGWLKVEMKRPRRILALRLKIFADRMRATQWTYKLQLAKSGFSIKEIREQFLY